MPAVFSLPVAAPDALAARRLPHFLKRKLPGQHSPHAAAPAGLLAGSPRARSLPGTGTLRAASAAGSGARAGRARVGHVRAAGTAGAIRPRAQSAALSTARPRLASR